jgi:DNA-binding NtrC family response regulator
MGNVLLVDDCQDAPLVSSDLADASNCVVTQVRNAREAQQCANQDRFDLMLIDNDLPDGSGLDLLYRIDVAQQGRIVLVAADPRVETAARAVRSPIDDYLLRPVEDQRIAELLQAARKSALERQEARSPYLGGMVGQSAAMMKLFEHIRRVAAMDVSVLIRGESGSGKELVARAIHELSGRRGRFVPVNCGAIASELAGSELFGHDRGAFTGAVQGHAGFFEQAEGGTLFLDEVTEMPLPQQVYLLRVLENRTLTRVGGSREIPVDVRIVAATNVDPLRAVESRTLRRDLYYRLQEFPLSAPPLSERTEDIPLLAQHFLDALNARYKTHHAFAPETLLEYGRRRWPGNVRELRHAVQRRYLLAEGEVLEPHPTTPERIRGDDDGAVHFRVGMRLEDMEREMLLKTLAHWGNNRRLAARSLGITARTVYNRLQRYQAQGLIGDELLRDSEAQ